jgi:hypothetical protein
VHSNVQLQPCRRLVDLIVLYHIAFYGRLEYNVKVSVILVTVTVSAVMISIVIHWTVSRSRARTTVAPYSKLKLPVCTIATMSELMSRFADLFDVHHCIVI